MRFDVSVSLCFKVTGLFYQIKRECLFRSSPITHVRSTRSSRQGLPINLRPRKVEQRVDTRFNNWKMYSLDRGSWGHCRVDVPPPFTYFLFVEGVPFPQFLIFVMNENKYWVTGELRCFFGPFTLEIDSRIIFLSNYYLKLIFKLQRRMFVYFIKKGEDRKSALYN